MLAPWNRCPRTNSSTLHLEQAGSANWCCPLCIARFYFLFPVSCFPFPACFCRVLALSCFLFPVSCLFLFLLLFPCLANCWPNLPPLRIDPSLAVTMVTEAELHYQTRLMKLQSD